ncbi:GlsB/YeaQ/YmgE family stress response membrane protein [Collimonas humicola]|uniref:GlsB/YeaQ/YmgE family stress response membrane protein n=1 Tax=Collimonas humicola TaxID=2825886 RepID=UPI001B8D991A|nr:GlsB/YeaQ/YmgE family stress response membrane protein [Collimonas humicola]
MEILGTIIVGFIVGVIAKLIHPGRENMGFIVTTLLGIAGSFLAGYVGQALGWYHAGQGAGFIGSIVGAFVLLVIYGFVKGKAAS